MCVQFVCQIIHSSTTCSLNINPKAFLTVPGIPSFWPLLVTLGYLNFSWWRLLKLFAFLSQISASHFCMCIWKVIQQKWCGEEEKVFCVWFSLFVCCVYFVWRLFNYLSLPSNIIYLVCLFVVCWTFTKTFWGGLISPRLPGCLPISYIFPVVYLWLICCLFIVYFLCIYCLFCLFILCEDV